MFRLGLSDRFWRANLSVEEALATAARRAWRLGMTYESVGHYDPVLRSHCRLDGSHSELRKDEQ